jgi:hypothetical protein
MDFVSHMLFGYAVDPSIESVVGSILPDVMLIGKRKADPPESYRWTHSILAVVLASLLDHRLALGISSHIILDSVSHGSKWSPRFFYPFSDLHLKSFKEWEFWTVQYFTILTIVICLFVIRIFFHLLQDARIQSFLTLDIL